MSDSTGGSGQDEDLRATVARLSRDLAEMQEVIVSAVDTLGALDTTAPAPAAAAPPKSAPLNLTELAEWVTGWLLPTFRRMGGGPGRRWCAQWWLHSEAIIRLEALHRSYDTLFAEGGTGPGLWFRDHLDPALDHLLSDNGTFATCGLDPLRHDPLPVLPSTPLPDGLTPAASAPSAA